MRFIHNKCPSGHFSTRIYPFPFVTLTFPRVSACHTVLYCFSRIFSAFWARVTPNFYWSLLRHGRKFSSIYPHPLVTRDAIFERLLSESQTDGSGCINKAWPACYHSNAHACMRECFFRRKHTTSPRTRTQPSLIDCTPVSLVIRLVCCTGGTGIGFPPGLAGDARHCIHRHDDVCRSTYLHLFYHALVALGGLVDQKLGRVHLPAPLAADRVRVMSAGGRRRSGKPSSTTWP